ncbi:MAG: hypothetical protein EPO22_00760 [Dehalococcoidia bacterium]|nr:MAG: hypothetical protein EPO22_00760 [Dehalococcoidia bacterium]
MVIIGFVGIMLFESCFLGGLWLLRRRGNATRGRIALLVVLTAGVFLVAPGYLATGGDGHLLIALAAATFWMVAVPLFVVLAHRH